MALGSQCVEEDEGVIRVLSRARPWDLEVFEGPRMELSLLLYIECTRTMDEELQSAFLS